MKQSWTCPKCHSQRIGYFDMLHDEAEASKPDGRVLGHAVIGQFMGATASQRVGMVEAFICADCGYFEEYLKDPANMPWDKLVNFRWCTR
jgi:predicted nucleic-acid-binding Zn-ribbon protein